MDSSEFALNFPLDLLNPKRITTKVEKHPKNLVISFFFS